MGWNRMTKELAASAGILLLGVFMVVYGSFNCWLFLTRHTLINCMWFLMYTGAGIGLSSYGVAILIQTLSYRLELKKLNKALSAR
jgi:hypothetical protein